MDLLPKTKATLNSNCFKPFADVSGLNNLVLVQPMNAEMPTFTLTFSIPHGSKLPLVVKSNPPLYQIAKGLYDNVECTAKS